MVSGIIGSLIGCAIGFLTAIFMKSAGQNNKNLDLYSEGYADGFSAGKKKYNTKEGEK
jgi:ABC-type lipoprotein release transport system permease subunit